MCVCASGEPVKAGQYLIEHGELERDKLTEILELHHRIGQPQQDSSWFNKKMVYGLRAVGKWRMQESLPL